MRTFKVMNTSTPDVCPICGTQKEEEVVLIAIKGTNDDGICQAMQFHLECIELVYDKKHGVLFQLLPQITPKQK